MSTQDQNNQTAAAQKLSSLKAELETTLARLRRRRNTMFVALLAVTVFMVSYLSFVYGRLAQVDAPTVVELAARQIEPSLNGASTTLSETLKSEAPTLIHKLEVSLLALPEQLAQEGRTQLNQTIRESFPTIEEELYRTLSDLIASTKAKAIENGINPDDPAAFDQIVQTIAPTIHEEARKTVDEFYRKYTASAADLIGYLQQLADNRNLDQRQQYHRQIVSLTLALMAKHADTSAPVTAQVDTDNH